MLHHMLQVLLLAISYQRHEHWYQHPLCEVLAIKRVELSFPQMFVC